MKLVQTYRMQKVKIYQLKKLHVQKVNDICCKIVCGEWKICVHTLVCIYQDYLIKSIIYKHIHQIAFMIKFIENIEENITTTMNNINIHRGTIYNDRN